MSSKLLISINDASSAVIPDTSAPDTGMFSVSHTDGVSFNTSMVLPIIGIIVLVIAIIVGIIVAVSRRKKVNRFTTHTNKHLVAKLTTLSVVVFLGALGVMNADKLTSMVNATADDSEDSLTITASDIKIDVDLNDKAVFATGESIVTVSSATEAGYTLMAYVDSTTTDLTNETNKSSKSKITMLSSNEPTALTDNTWGIATTKPTSQTSAVFTGFPTTQDTAITLKTTEEATTAGDKSTFYYGTYITPDLDYGTYSGTTITYIAIANYAGPCNPNATTIQEAKCLQDFAGPNRDQIVDSMTPETQYTLMDMRDEKNYTIAKLYAMGRTRTVQEPIFSVWMTQNLDLDINSDITYTNKDTDLGYNQYTGKYEAASWKPSRSTYATTSTQTHEWCKGGTWVRNHCEQNFTPESYDPGNLYWNTQASNLNDWFAYSDSCNYSPSGPLCDQSLNPISTYTASTGIPQYHLGNYYNWTAAIAMNDSSSITEEEDIVKQSICPAGWTLPGDDESEESFYSLLEYYGPSSDTSGDENTLWTSPLYYVASGNYDGIVWATGRFGNFWSSVPYDEMFAKGVLFETNGIMETSSNGFRLYGYPVRCVARLSADYAFEEEN